MTTEDKKAYLGAIHDGENARAIIGSGLWREIDLPGHPGAALVVWAMEEDADSSSPEQELNARKLVAGFNVCELLSARGDFDFIRGCYEEAQQGAERPIPQMSPLQAAMEALAIAESHIKDQLQGTDEYEPAMIQLNPVRAAIIAAGGST